MTTTTVTHSTPPRAALSASDARAFELLTRHAVKPALDVQALRDVKASFPAPRSTGQVVLSGTWGRDEVYDRAMVAGHRVERGAGLGLRGGLTTTLRLMPGAVSLSVCDLNRVEAARARAAGAAAATVDLMVPVVPFGPVTAAAEPLWAPERVPSRVITEWSSKSRSRMLKAFMAVDWSALDVDGKPLGMVTLTYPGDWLRCAPTGRVVKRHLRAFRQAFYRACGHRLDGAWKLEFQDRGAPHFHLLLPVPPVTADGQRFESWLSLTWANIVHRSLSKEDKAAHIAEGHYGRHLLAGTGVDFSKAARMSDPKRLAVYFYKHGTKTADAKEYQHKVPRAWLVDEHGEVTPESGPGRFWGFWGMAVVDVALDLDVSDFLTARRYLRRVARARVRATNYARARHVLPARIAMHPARVRKMIGQSPSRTRVLSGGRLQGGFVIVNDGAALGAQLARAINLSRLN